ncbi:hypothetical protein [Plantibacter sp. YIM 135249]|uniref:hypothetical protein n=1 Tax=Plantibacter sp. YIM 135249 TaxID=3423918 RepID=UPI003D32603B
MSDIVIVALISAAALVLTAPASVLMLLVNRRVKALGHQVANDHSVNLRDDLDGKHSETGDLLRELVRDLGGMKQDVRLIRQDQSTHESRIHALEQKENTWPGSTPR